MYFVEQLDMLGKALSLAGRRADAVSCYERALTRDPQDAYAHHYKAYNLDVEGLRAQDVDRHYTDAIAHDREHVWYHGRYVCFLITRGRMGDARAAWLDALSQLSVSGRLAAWHCRELHLPVARLLLHRGELDFARDVLDDARGATDAAWLDGLERYYEHLREAQRDEIVFPPHIPVNERWSPRPHLVPPDDEALVESWMPGRLERYEGDSVILRVALMDGDQPRFARRMFATSLFRDLCARPKALRIPAGTFLEIVRLKPDGERILLHDPSRPPIALPEILPPPDRYLRRGAAPA
jgi:hypothetical protein